MALTRPSTRRNALDKLAVLSAQPTTAQGGGDDIAKLCELQQPASYGNGTLGASDRKVQTSSVPMGIKELEVLIALCKAAPLVQTTADAANLLHQLAPYVPEAHKQTLKPSPLYQHLPPWETLARDLTAAVLAIGLNHPSLKQQALAVVDRTIEELTTSAEQAIWFQPSPDGTTGLDAAERSLPAIKLAVSLLGFLDATATHARVWTPDQRLSVVQRLRYLLSEKFMVSLEGALSAVRNARTSNRTIKEWKRWVKHYATKARPLGAMLLQQAFMVVVEQAVILLITTSPKGSSSDLLDTLLERVPLMDHAGLPPMPGMFESLTEIIVDEMNLLEADEDYLQVSSAWQQHLAFEVKAGTLRSFLICSLLDEEVADVDLLIAWLDGVTADPVQIADDKLAETVLKSMAILARTSPAIAANLSRILPRLIVQGKMTAPTAALAGQCLACVVKRLSQDVLISTLYSLGNVLSATAGQENKAPNPLFDGNASINGTTTPYQSQQALGSAISLVLSDEEETASRYGSVAQAIVAIATAARDEQITALVISMLVQKVGRVSPAVDARIIAEMAPLGLCGGANELRALLRLYARITTEATVKGDSLLIDAISTGRTKLAFWIKKDSPLYEIYLAHLLGLCVGSGDTAADKVVDVVLTSKLISQLFRPMAVLVSSDLEHQADFESPDELSKLSRNAWFNIVVHGFTLSAQASKPYMQELQALAQYTLPLVDEERVDYPESAIDLNTVLRRGNSAQHAVEQKNALIDALPQIEADVKGLTYQDCVFLNAALLVTNLRARAGDCTAALPYFMESKVKTHGSMGNCMFAIAFKSVDTFVRHAQSGSQQSFSAPQVALQLATFFEGCCHRIEKVQHAALSSADRIINAMPSALCHKASLFALLELLSLMWKSCLDAETDEYDWKFTYHSAKGNVTVQLSDNVQYRQTTLSTLQNRAHAWVSRAMEVAPLDVKGLLQAYLEDFEDDGSYHVALGRSFALRMGSMIPSTDQRLTSLDRPGAIGIDTASDFIAQYTTRQEYRHHNNNFSHDDDWALVDYNGNSRTLAAIEGKNEAVDEALQLRQLARRLKQNEVVPFSIVRETLRNAAAVLSRSTSDQTPLIQHLVAIPFFIFTKASINLGIALWLGVVKENPSLETRVLAEVAAGWESSIRLKKGFFTPYNHLDPFYVKEEFAPSKWEAISKWQQAVHNLVTPHLRLTQYLSSHLSASRLSSPNVEKVYARLMRITMLAMKHMVTQPLAREVHFHIVLLSTRVLRYATRPTIFAQWRLKDAILSAGLSWFARSPRWSFGSNRLQLKAEIKLLNDVISSLQAVTGICARPTKSLASLQSKQELLVLLLQHEIGRLNVWITPLGSDSKGGLPLGHGSATLKDIAFAGFLGTAWNEDPRIAVQLATRFPRSERLERDIRWYIMREPEKVIHEADALYIMLGSSLPPDVRTQLKYLLFWAPINPMAAVTYFLPAYGNHPFIIQYAVRALESHSVDVTFFYVPQIVQALRYDALGYVERYIVETAKFSQLFAHQIIWNMKANSYKDEDSQEPDPVKPVLDKVMDALISSFSAEDKVFYEREFDFFGKVTGISGALKPYIKRPKPEKKQKIEEELRKIQLEVGVYLPSNPDGSVVGIDRKSGKPLQSHAKAPFMATFRIRKEEQEIEGVGNEVAQQNGDMVKHRTYEVWQSAIFKVGDDCRQDVLALQLIAAFRGIFNNVGLDVYVFPYRVTATAPGCGVIDVLPNSISRDMLGREAVNGLYEYFVSKYGSEDSIRFQEARSNFIKSMAAYSIISYLLQFKDRHNGNIMVDDAGHILHIDFGFCFDIAPGGVKFERAPFKLSPEMVAVMGGANSQSFRAFEELCVKAFLAARQYVEQLSHIVLTMLDSGLPCFKPQTIQHFKERFVLEKDDREAAEFVRKLVHWSERSYSTAVYDYFQLLTNGIPY
ncbi:phosphatidylinositol-4-kinase [Teratosphaeria nubilosa]|uniref:1-phosphatidylinositol 4-kinase n=1 Tax=Teratosphaeria nubilosa TaxID=161662 RepID=A0A6G1KWK9_9PEZI|nr:phosphatidylinositol-4-kinase [Teratosphaeria nubilosa]